MDAFVNLLEPDRMPSMTKAWLPLIPYRKDKYLSPVQLKLHVLNSQATHEIIEEFARREGRERRDVEEIVRRLLEEIGLAYDMPVIRWAGIMLNRLLTKMCSGVYVNDVAMSRVRATLGDRPVLYLPCHRSYLDFVLMSYVCFAYDLSIPGIAAGMDFHGMFGVGTFMRKTGAFYMRRTFSDDELYWRVFREYMHSLIVEYHIGIEFFLEGTRSRSYKALPAKIGLLAMALQPLFVGELHDVTIVPIGFAYEKPLEEQRFTYEMIGLPKPKESTLAMINAMNVIGTPHGSWYINFGEPISAREYFGEALDRMRHAHLPFHVQHLTRDELKMVADVGQHVVVQQQRLITLTAFNLIAVCFGYGVHGERVELSELLFGVDRLAYMLRTLGALVALKANQSAAENDIRASIELQNNIFALRSTDRVEWLELLRPDVNQLPPADKLRALRAHQFCTETLRNAIPVITLQIYSNPCMFWLVKPALALLAIRELMAADKPIELDAVERRSVRLQRMFDEEFVLDRSVSVEQTVASLVEWDVLDRRTLRIDDDRMLNDVHLLLCVLKPFLYVQRFVVQALMDDFGAEPFAESALHVRTQQRVEAALADGQPYVHAYCLSLDSIEHSVRSLLTNGCLAKTKTVNSYRMVQEDAVRLLFDDLTHLCQLLPVGRSSVFEVQSTPDVLAKL